MKKNKKIGLSIFLAFSMMVGVAGCAKKSEPVAMIDGQPLSEAKYKGYLLLAKLNFEQISGPDIWDIEMDGKTMEEVAKERALESAVATTITTKKAKEMKVELTAEDKEYAKQSTTEFMTQLGEKIKEEGIAEDTIGKMMEEFLLSQKVSTELANKFAPAEDVEGYKKFVEENKSYFEQVKAQHVLIKTVDDNYNPLPEEKQKEAKAKAEEVLQKALAGEDMGKLAKEYSEDPGSKDNNGEYTFPRGQMVPEFEDVAFNGEPGKVHPEIVQTSYGYHIVKTVEKISASEEEMKKAFEENQKREYVNNEIDEWIKSAKVEKTALYDTITVKKPEASPSPEATTAPQQTEETKEK